jgi:hypothetical protein
MCSGLNLGQFRRVLAADQVDEKMLEATLMTAVNKKTKSRKLVKRTSKRKRIEYSRIIAKALD